MNQSKSLILIGSIVTTALVVYGDHQLFSQDLDLISLSSPLILTQNKPKTLAEKLAHDYLEKIPIAEREQELTVQEAQQIQAEFIKLLSPKLGKVVGYKAGLTSKKVQEKFKVNHPLSGVLLEQMLLPSGAVISSQFGARSMLEGDLIVRVKSEDINQVTKPGETLQYLDAVIPFLELPDLVYGENIKPTAAELLAINVGARLGIIGEPIMINNSQQWLDKLNKIQVIIRAEDDQELAKGESSNLLGHPLKVVLWLKDELNKQGIFLQKGDLLSLGSLTPLIPVKKDTMVKIEYLGLDTQPIEIKVKFTE